jgi:hypothetical protein
MKENALTAAYAEFLAVEGRGVIMIHLRSSSSFLTGCCFKLMSKWTK